MQITVEPPFVMGQRKFIASLTKTPPPYQMENDRGMPFLVKRLDTQTRKPGSEEFIDANSCLIKHLLDSKIIRSDIILPETQYIVRLFNAANKIVYDAEAGQEAILIEPSKDGKTWQRVKHDGKSPLYFPYRFWNPIAYSDGTYSVDGPNARVLMCWQGTTISRLLARNNWEALFAQSRAFTEKVGPEKIERLTALKLPGNKKLIELSYDNSTGHPMYIKYINGDTWKTADGATWTITNGKQTMTIENAYVMSDRNGNISYMRHLESGRVICYTETPCGRRIISDNRLDTELLMRGGM